MNYLEQIQQWISDNERLLSGLAALVALAGVILAPLGMGLRRLRAC